MKIKVSAVFLFVISCFHAQEIKDKDAFEKCRKENSKKICISDKDEDHVLLYLDQCPEKAGPVENNGCPWTDFDGDDIPDKDDPCPADFGYASDDPQKNGCMKEDCKKKYEEALARLKKFQEESKLVDYDKLQDKIINDLNLKLLKEENVVVFNKNQMVTCGTVSGKNYYCPAYYEYETPVYTTDHFWNDKAVEKIYDKLPKNIIFASNYEGLGSGAAYEKDPILNRNNKQVRILDQYKVEHETILYPKLKNIQTKINKYSSLFVKILKNDFENKIKVMVVYKTADRYGEKFIINYQYLDNEWKTIETNKEK